MEQNSKFFQYGITEKGLHWSIFFIFLIIFFVNYSTVWAEIPILRIGIFLNYNQVTLKGDKGLHIYEMPSMKKLLFREKNQSLRATANSAGIEISNQLYHSTKAIKIVPGDGGFIQVEDRKYRGEIEIILNQKSINVINVIEMEKYLYGVLKKEISPEWPEEALKAQAIASRTFALSNMNKYIDEGYNICATTNSQAYGGIYHEHPATNKAVNDTKGIIVTYKGEPINAVYHSDSGGYTENSEDVWGSYIPYLRSVPSDYEEIVSPPNHQWDCSLAEQEILAKLAQYGFQINGIENIVANGITESGRVQLVDIFDNNHEKITMKTNDFRLLIGPTVIRSPLFTITKTGGQKDKSIPQDNNKDLLEQKEQPQKRSVGDILKEERDFSISELIALLNRPREENESEEITLPEPKFEKNIESMNILFTFRGKGNGHGVGLSQWGAYGMSSQGFNYEDILKYYYQDIQLTKLY